MAVIITRMPSTGVVTNTTHDSRPVEEVRRIWAGINADVEVVDDNEWVEMVAADATDIRRDG